MNIPESLEEIQKLVADGKLSLVQICKEYIQRIKSSKTNAFIEIFEEESLIKAKEVQSKIINKNSLIIKQDIVSVEFLKYFDDYLDSFSIKKNHDLNFIFRVLSLEIWLNIFKYISIENLHLVFPIMFVIILNSSCY